LIKLYLLLIDGKFSHIKKVKFHDGKTKEIVVFKQKNPLFEGQAVPLLDIILIEDSLFKAYSKIVQSYILEHEYAHTKLKWLFLLIFPVRLLLGLFIFLSIPPNFNFFNLYIV